MTQTPQTLEVQLRVARILLTEEALTLHLRGLMIELDLTTRLKSALDKAGLLAVAQKYWNRKISLIIKTGMAIKWG